MFPSCRRHSFTSTSLRCVVCRDVTSAFPRRARLAGPYYTSPSLGKRGTVTPHPRSLPPDKVSTPTNQWASGYCDASSAEALPGRPRLESPQTKTVLCTCRQSIWPLDDQDPPNNPIGSRLTELLYILRSPGVLHFSSLVMCCRGSQDRSWKHIPVMAVMVAHEWLFRGGGTNNLGSPSRTGL